MRSLAIPALAGLLAGLCTACAAGAGGGESALSLGDLLLVGFRGTEVEGNAEIRRLLCELKVGGVILFDRDVATGNARNLESRAQVSRLTSGLQRLALGCAGRP